MICIDTNILVHAHRRDSAWHPAAQAKLSELAEGRGAWAIPWPCIHEFLAVVTHPKIFSTPTPPEAALDQVEAWMESPSLELLGESDQHWAALRPMLAAGRIRGPKVHDARIAALCIQHGARELWSADRDFSRFPGLKVVNPLVG